MPLCECGCGGETKTGKFLPGHDQKLRSQIEDDLGGLLALRDLAKAARRYVNAGTSLEQYGAATEKIIKK